MSPVWYRPSLAGALAAVGCVVGLLQSAPASAFSDIASYRNPPGASGGGNRYFTGSPLDAYTCKVCHEGAPNAGLEVSGLPLTAYEPGVSYEIVVRWPEDVEHFATSIELTDMKGRRAGQLLLSPEDEIEDPEYCEPVINKVAAAALTLVPPRSKLDESGYCSEAETLPADCRQIVSVLDCGAKRLRFAWKAPREDVGQVWFAGSAVRANADGEATGDGVTDLGRVIGSPKSPDPYASSTSTGCSVLRPRAAPPSTLGVVLGLALLALGRRRRFH